MAEAKNYHANALRIADNGILIDGPSGSGKTTLSLHLIDWCAQNNVPAAIISDDQVELEKPGGALMAHAPKAIAGKLELPHFGIINIPHEPSVTITRVFRLQEGAERICEEKAVEIKGISLPMHSLPMRNEEAARRIILYLLGFWPNWR